MRVGIGIGVLTLLTATVDAQTVTVTSSSPVEAKLASIDARTKVVPLSTIRQYSQVLNSVDRKCKENRTQIGDVTVKGVEILAAKKVKMTLLKFLQAMDASMPPGAETLQLSCVEIGAILATAIQRP